ncbi:hypothetical protein [Moraxella lacunata]|uniref:hypothetical protein n=1 Tax=Moraxella lacunata TaxID=477 RepID=UPI003EE3AA74
MSNHKMIRLQNVITIPLFVIKVLMNFPFANNSQRLKNDHAQMVVLSDGLWGVSLLAPLSNA